MKWGGKEVESSLHRATGAIIRCNPGKILTKSEVQYIRVSGNIALMLPILRGEGLLPVPGYRQRLHAARDNHLDDNKCAKIF